jgi:flagellar motor protein MotB
MSGVFSRRLPRRTSEGAEDIFAPVADLMVGMVFIFIVVMVALVLNQAEEATVPRSEYDEQVAKVAKLEAEAARLRAELDEERRLRAQAEEDRRRLAEFAAYVRDHGVLRLMDRLSRADETRALLLREMERRLSVLGINVTVDQQAGTLQLPSRNLFDIGQATPTPVGAQTIERLGEVMARVLPCHVGTGLVMPGCATGGEESSLSAVYIEGHTDNQPFAAVQSRFRNNWDLSAGRAIEAYTLIQDRFERLRTLRNAQGEALLGVSGYADTRAAKRDATERERSTPETRDKDRRIEIRVVMATNQAMVGSILQELNRRLEAIDGLLQ